MEAIKNLFIKHFGFLPDVISTTEHSYISPPSRIFSSLLKLASFSNKKVLRIIITDNFSCHPEPCINQICIPHFLNKKLFYINNNFPHKKLVQVFEEDILRIENILNCQCILSKEEKSNYFELINLYREILNYSKNVDSTIIYNNIIKKFTYCFDLFFLFNWLNNNKIFAVDSMVVRCFLKEAFDILTKINSGNVDFFGKYIESKKRLKVKESNNIINISWKDYLKKLNDNSTLCSVPFEIILYVYSYCGGSHFGNDYGFIDEINKLRKTNNLFQITKHNKDFSFKIEEDRVPFYKVSMVKNNWNLSNKIYKNAETLPELYVLLGKNSLKDKLKKYLNL